MPSAIIAATHIAMATFPTPDVAALSDQIEALSKRLRSAVARQDLAIAKLQRLTYEADQLIAAKAELLQKLPRPELLRLAGNRK